MFSKTVIGLVSFAVLCSLSGVQSDRPRYILQNTKVTYFEALRNCNDLGLQLASVNNAQDNTLLKAAIGTQTGPWWSAGTDLGDEMKWMWITSKNPFGYTNWAPGQPENADTNENCLIVEFPVGQGETRWKDEPCGTKYKYICEPKSEQRPNRAG